MSLKIDTERSPERPVKRAAENNVVVVVREYEEERDKVAVVEMERRCEVVGERGKPSLVTDLMGDPFCRIRHFPSRVMLIAEYGEEKEIVGVIRGCVKTVTRGKSVYVNLAYILGLRVSPSYRRFGIATKLVQHLEEWCKQKGVRYAYMATDCKNQPSINLFTLKCAYVKFRTPTILVHPVHAHYKPLGSGIAIVKLPPRLAGKIYHQLFSGSEFFSNDIDAILVNKLNLGTFMALPKNSLSQWNLHKGILPQSFAILSVWNTKEMFRFQVNGVSTLTYALCMGSRVLDKWLPWLKLPSIPNFFKQFGVYFLYGLIMEGKGASRLMKSLCAFAHNMAKDDKGCRAIVAQVGQQDPIKKAIPHWRKFSWSEDQWCMKKLVNEKEAGVDENCELFDNWIESRSSTSVIFVDPRDF